VAIIVSLRMSLGDEWGPGGRGLSTGMIAKAVPYSKSLSYNILSNQAAAATVP